MVTYILILFFHVGTLGDTDSNTTTTVPGFTNKQECEQAGSDAKRLVNGTVKELNYVCVKQTR
jgi:hypothetical protein